MTGRKMRTGFAMVPDWVIQRVTDGSAMRVYLHLACKYANADRHAFPEVETLACELDVSARTVKRAIATLQATGAVLVSRVRQPDGYFGRNLYTLPLDDPTAQGPNLAPGDDQHERGVPAGGDQGPNLSNQGPNMAPPGGDRFGPSKEQPDPKNQPDQKQTPKPSAAAPGAPEPVTDLFGERTPSRPGRPPRTGVSAQADTGLQFDRFWKIYPRKVAKKKARAAWDKAVLEADPELLISTAETYAKIAEPRYTKHPATWLNGGCWDDDPAAVNLRLVSGEGYRGWHGPEDQSAYEEPF